jgi:hypothetical protein
MYTTRKDGQKQEAASMVPPESGDYLRARDAEIAELADNIDFDEAARVAAREILDDVEASIRVLVTERDAALSARDRAADELERVALERDQCRGLLGDQGAQIAEYNRLIVDAKRLRDRLIVLERFAADVTRCESAPADLRAAARAALEEVAA